jgi:hypothetical protein
MTSRAKSAIAAIFTVASVATTPASAHRLTLNDTGMTECIDHQNDWSSECAKSRQDAAEGRDVHDADPDDGKAGFSFRKVCRSGEMAGEGSCPPDPVLGYGPNDWGCVYDNVTQLTWEAKTADGGVHDYLRRFTNKGKRARDKPTDAAWLVDATNSETLCGATNWRLPDELELQSLVDYGVGTPDGGGAFIDQKFFFNSFLSFTWTGAEYIRDSKRAWYVDFSSGRIAPEQQFYPAASARVVHRAKRSPSSGQPVLTKDRFIPSDDGTEVTDRMTGLVWRRCSAGMVWNEHAQSCDGTANEFLWKDALDYAAANRKGGWRLPNAKELFSIVDHLTQSPAIDHLAFPDTPRATFWSSTPMYSPGGIYIQVVEFDSGMVYQFAYKFESFPVRLVRRGRE